jgi:hypothetical protein
MEKKPEQKPVRIELTPEQKEKLRTLTGKDVPVLELSVMELEDRIAPAISRN